MKLVQTLPLPKLNPNHPLPKDSTLFMELHHQISNIIIPPISMDPPLCFKKNDNILNKNGNTLWLLKKLYQEYPVYFDSEMVGYLTNTSCLDDSKCVEWLDTSGSAK